MVTLIPSLTSHIKASFALIGLLQGIRYTSRMQSCLSPRCLRLMSSMSPVSTLSPQEDAGRGTLDRKDVLVAAMPRSVSAVKRRRRFYAWLQLLHDRAEHERRVLIAKIGQRDGGRGGAVGEAGVEIAEGVAARGEELRVQLAFE